MRSRHAHGDVALVRAAQLSYAQVYDAHVETVYRYVHRRCQDHSLAEDVTQDTFIAAIRNTDDPATITIAWLITVARNRLFDVLRRQTKYEEKLQLVANNTSRPDEIDVAERLRVEAALGVLPVHYRLVLTLHYINGMTVPAIADELDQSLKSIEGLVTRARKELSAVLDEAEPQSTEGGES
jgi:RNA polymerase sigma-70 factor (ECF subfamily)